MIVLFCRSEEHLNEKCIIAYCLETIKHTVCYVNEASRTHWNNKQQYHTHTNIYNGVWWQEYWNNHTHGNIVSKMSRSMCSKRAFESTYIAMLAMLAMLNHLLMEIIFVFLTCVFSLWSGFHSKSKIIDIQQKCFDISVRTTSFDYCTARTKSIAKFLLFQFYCSIHIIVVISSDHTFFILYMCIHEAI